MNQEQLQQWILESKVFGVTALKDAVPCPAFARYKERDIPCTHLSADGDHYGWHTGIIDDEEEASMITWK